MIDRWVDGCTYSAPGLWEVVHDGLSGLTEVSGLCLSARWVDDGWWLSKVEMIERLVRQAVAVRVKLGSSWQFYRAFTVRRSTLIDDEVDDQSMHE